MLMVWRVTAAAVCGGKDRCETEALAATTQLPYTSYTVPARPREVETKNAVQPRLLPRQQQSSV